jgi:hypothetical protein
MDVGSFVHSSFGLRGLASHPYCPTWRVYPFLPLATLIALVLWLINCKPWAVDRRSLRGHKLELWTVPRLGLAVGPSLHISRPAPQTTTETEKCRLPVGLHL